MSQKTIKTRQVFRVLFCSKNKRPYKQDKYILQLAYIWPCHLIQRLNEGIADIFIGYCPVRTRAKTCLWDSTNLLHKVEDDLPFGISNLQLVFVFMFPLFILYLYFS